MSELVFSKDEPPILAPGRMTSRWNRMLVELQRNPGKWAVLEKEHRRTGEHLRDIWADLPVDIRAIPTGDEVDRAGRTMYREVWLRWEG